ncbi:tetratricopeptide repeat protein [Chitinophaga sp. sic0106]|uniref:tetratricopeptide repeat protein n=1 Tax=Chitinophaga sp. sic0106 TaxID=2854785 RepID=UPI001C45A43F|nr:tetratricopeptide repeat protein [Chitinophaga sp. sic0106]MBV7531452.1 tetratricopeptide repeat protein [Chitinophaga sp. sic0106]
MLYRFIIPILLVCFAIEAQGQIINLRKRKNKSEEYYNQAVAETKQQHYAKAIELSKKALADEPDFIDQELLLARLYMLTKQYDLSRKYIKQVLDKNPKYKDAYYYGINVETTTGRYAEAECFVDEALLNFPGSKEFKIKKINILDAQGKLRRADGYAEELMDNFPEDTVVRRAYIDHYLEAGYYHQKNGNYTLARTNFDRVLAVDPNNKDAREATLGAELNGGNRSAAMAIIDQELAKQPNNYELLMKKLGLLQETHQYAEAISVLQQIYRKYPNDAKARSIENTLRMEAAAYYTNTDPYMLYLSVLEKNPGNREALDKVIGYAMTRGAYIEALTWINRGLRATPNDSRLLGLKLDVLEADHKYGAAAAIAEILYQRAPTADLTERLTDLQLRSGREYLKEEQYDLALAAFQSGLKISPKDTNLLSLVANTYLLMKDNKGALKAVDNALAYYPDNEKYLIRKAAILEASGQYEEAAQLLGRLSARHPGDEGFKSTLVDLRLSMGRNLMRAEEFEAAKQQFAALLEAQPDNRDALDYMINMQSATGKADSAVYYADNALAYYPNDKDILLKKAGALQQLGRNNEAAAITAGLMARYPYTVKYRDAYTTSLLAAASDYQKAQQADSALQMFEQVLALNPKDSLALQSSINLLNAQQRYDSALVYVNEGLRYYPDNEGLLLKRAVTLENKKDFTGAALAADTLARKYPTAANKDYYDLLHSKTLRNQFALYYLNSSYDYTSNKYNIATVEYRRFMKRGGSYAFRLDYAGRQNGNGLQAEAEMYYVHNPKLYSYGLLTYSNKVVFPQLRASYSLFKTFGKDIEGELGARYLSLDSITSVSGVVSIAKPFGDFWVNFRAYVISEESDMYTSFNLTTRYYTDAKRQDFVSVIAGLGTSPDDRSRLINLPQLSGLLTHSVAAGYQKVIKYRTTLGLYGTWINSKVADNQYNNQYDIYLVFMRKF